MFSLSCARPATWESTIGQYEKTIKALTSYARRHGTSIYTPALGAGFASLTISPRTGRFSAQRRSDYRRLVACSTPTWRPAGWICRFVNAAAEARSRPVERSSWRLPLRGKPRWPIAAWLRRHARLTAGCPAATCRSWSRAGSSALRPPTAERVLAFLASLSARWAKTSLFWVVSNFRPFLAFTGRTDLVDAAGLAGVKAFPPDPAGSQRRRPAPGRHRMRVGAVCARDAAITLLALSTGLRACDIIDLRLADIDWRGRTISIVQQKTGNPLTVPLTALLVARLADYVLDDRPGSGDDHVFLRQVAPHVRLADHASIHRVTAEVFRAAGVTGVKAGTRLLRHNAASRLLRAATPLPTISAVLGHASEESTKLYMSVDRGSAARCVLPVPEGARP